MINFFGEINFRNKYKKIGIKQNDRNRHIYVIGKTGVGKTTLLKNMIIQDILNNQGVSFIDPHGDAAEELLDFIPKNRINDVVYFNPADFKYPIAFNVMYKVSDKYYYLIAFSLMETFKKMWPDVWSARMEYILSNCIMALLESPNATLLGINRMLSDATYRRKVIKNIKNPLINNFWRKEYASYTARYETEAKAAIQNKIGQLISNPIICNIIGQVKSKFDIKEIINNKKILIVNLSKGKIGEEAAMLLGSLLIIRMQIAASARANIPEQERENFYLYVDEFQDFARASFANILSEARKYRLCLTLAHQYIAQMDEEVLDAVFGNIGTIICFRVGAQDATYLEKEFLPEFGGYNMINLEKYYFCLKLMLNQTTQKPFLAKGLAPFIPLKYSNKEKIINSSRERYTLPASVIEAKIFSWLKT